MDKRVIIGGVLIVGAVALGIYALRSAKAQEKTALNQERCRQIQADWVEAKEICAGLSGREQLDCFTQVEDQYRRLKVAYCLPRAGARPNVIQAWQARRT